MHAASLYSEALILILVLVLVLSAAVLVLETGSFPHFDDLGFDSCTAMSCSSDCGAGSVEYEYRCAEYE